MVNDYYAKVFTLNGRLILSGRGYGWARGPDGAYYAKSLVPENCRGQ